MSFTKFVPKSKIRPQYSDQSLRAESYYKAIQSGMTYREVGSLEGISKQRVHQLVSDYIKEIK